MSEETDNPFQSEGSAASEPAGSGIFIPLAIGLVGVVLGGIALFLSLSGSGKSKETQSALKDAAEQTSSLELRLSEIEQKLARFELSLSSQEQQMRVMASQTQSALNQIGQEINSTRQQVTVSAAKINEIAEKFKKGSSPKAVVRPNLPPEETEVAGEAGEDADTLAPNGSSIAKHNEHVIARGDTFAKLSSKYKVTIDEILAANPDADPRRLQIGQRISIPQSVHSRE